MTPGRLLFATLTCGALLSCVTTRTLDAERSPDPRADLPALPTPKAKDAQPFASFPTVIDADMGDPIVNVRVAFRAGSADDPEGKEGVAHLTAALMAEATEELSSAELPGALFPWAAELGWQVDKDVTVFVGRVHRDHVGSFIHVFLDVLLRPRLDAADFERLKAAQRAGVESELRNSNDEALQREALEALLYDRARLAGGELVPPLHPYRTTAKGTVAGIAALTLEDVRAFRATHLTRDRIVLGVSGGAEAGVIKRVIDDLMTLPESKAARAEPGAPIDPKRNTALFIDKPAAGTAISVGFALESLSRAHPDYPALKLAETWFGEHRNLIGHLFSSMREKRGLNYGDYAYVEHFVQEGWSTYELLNIPRRTQYFSMWIRPVENKNRMFALRQTLWELDGFAKHGIPDDGSFERVRAFVAGYYKSKEQLPMRKLGYRMDAVLTGQPFDRDGLRERIAKLSRAEVNAAIARHLRADRLSIVVITDGADAFKNDVIKNTPSPMKYAATPPAGVPEEDKLILARPLALEADAIVIRKPADLFAQ